MRLFTWNINHRSRPKVIPNLLVEAIGALAVDVVVLTEYVPGTAHTKFLMDLASIGLEHNFVSTYTPKENHILIASKNKLREGSIIAPRIAPSVPSNSLHVHQTSTSIEILGIRVPDYSKQPNIKRKCWDWILTTADEVLGRPFIILGDFNTDARYSKARCGDRIGALICMGWQHAMPLAGSSYWTPRGTGVCIDHAFLTKHFVINHAEYVKEHNGYLFAGKEHTALSDHAGLLIDVGIR